MAWLKSLAVALALWGAGPLAALTQDQDQAEPPQAFVTRAVFADGRLWLLTDAHSLISLAEDSPAPRPESPPGPVLDLCRHRGQLVALTGSRFRGLEWKLYRRVDDGWRSAGVAARRQDWLIGMDCGTDRVILLSSDRLIEMQPGGPLSVDLSETLYAPRVGATFLATDRYFFVGLNEGERGGGLRRIDRASGDVVTVANETHQGACSGLLVTNCDPVRAIVAEPWSPGCVAVAIGLVHFFPNGRIVEICGREVRALYVEPTPLGVEGAGEEDRGTVAFFGLMRAGDALRAVGVDGIYLIRRGGGATFAPFPRFRNVGGIELSFGLPDAVLVVTAVDRRASVSFGTPLMVPR